MACYEQQFNLTSSEVKELFGLAFNRGSNFSDLFHESRQTTFLTLRGGNLSDIEVGISEGIGIRVIAHGKVGYAYTEKVDKKSLRETVQAASDIAISNKKNSPRIGRPADEVRHNYKKPHWLCDEEEKVDILHRAHAGCTGNSSIIESRVVYRDTVQHVTIINSEGVWIADTRTLIGLGVFLVGQRGNRRVNVKRNVGGQHGLEYLINYPPEQLGREASKALDRQLIARDSPKGEMPVIIARGDGGVLIHEAIGHAFEGDRVNKGSTFYSGLRGKQVANKIISVYDDATIPNRQGSYCYDDEGTPGARTVLINKGRLEGYLENRLSAQEGNRPLSGNARRQSYRFPPIPRMSCTYIGKGSSSPDDIIRSVKKGLYVTGIGGGRSDISGGNFVFSATESFMIRNGCIEEPVSGVTLVGIGKRVLHEIDAVGHDFGLDPGGLTGYCGRAGQIVPVSFGQPTILVRKMIVG